MRKIDFHQSISMLANIGVIASIVFLGLELRQNNNLLAVQTRATYASMDQAGWSYVIENPTLIAALIKDRNGEKLTDVEEFRLNALWMQGFAQYQFRYLEDPDSTSWVAGQRRLFKSYPSLRQTWQGNTSGARQSGKDNFDPRFVQFYDENVANHH